MTRPIWPSPTGWNRPTSRRSPTCPPNARNDADVTDIRWMLAELRVSLFAQTLGTQAPVSENRILSALSRLHP